jgi:hypothetical protein
VNTSFIPSEFEWGGHTYLYQKLPLPKQTPGGVAPFFYTPGRKGARPIHLTSGR